jgi:hypothetical protein
MTAQEKLDLDLRDFWKIHDGLQAYATLDAKAMMDRLKSNKEDACCEVTNYAGTGKLMCTRDGYNAILELAERHRESMPVPDDYSDKELAKGICKHIASAMVDEKQDEPALARVLGEAVADADKKHFKRTYHFPCVIVQYDKPPQFRIGPVAFTAANSFPQVFAQDIQSYVDAHADHMRSTERVAKFQEYISNFGWLASVTVPPCAEEPAKRRAERAVVTALNLLRLVFGVDYGRDMRLAHTAFSQPRQTEYAVSENGKLIFVWSRRSSGALVEKDWYLAMDKWQGFWRSAAHLVSMAVSGLRSETSERVIDALTWFGDAAFESVPGIQIVNFVAALERLTTTESFSTHKFCSRVALLAFEEDSDFEKTYREARTIHTSRSRVIHGGVTPNDPEISKSLRLAHKLTQNALFRGLEMRCLLDDSGKIGGLADLQSFFTSQQSKRATMLKKLEQEFKEQKGRTVRK